jgi:hypothetical protein
MFVSSRQVVSWIVSGQVGVYYKAWGGSVRGGRYASFSCPEPYLSRLPIYPVLLTLPEQQRRCHAQGVRAAEYGSRCKL